MHSETYCRVTMVVVTLLVIVAAFSNTVAAQFTRNTFPSFLPGSLPNINLPRLEGQSCSGMRLFSGLF